MRNGSEIRSSRPAISPTLPATTKSAFHRWTDCSPTFSLRAASETETPPASTANTTRTFFSGGITGGRPIRHLLDSDADHALTTGLPRRLTRDTAVYAHLPKVHADETRTQGLDRLELIRSLQIAQTLTVHHGALAYLLGINALRAAEAAAVRIENYAGTLGGHRVLHLVGKATEPATMPLTVPVLRVIEACRGQRTEGPLVLRPTSGKPIDRRDVYRMVLRIAKAAQIPRHISPHSLRHAAITNTLDAGVPLRDAQVLARHADPRTTQHYDRARGNLDRHGVHFLTAKVRASSPRPQTATRLGPCVETAHNDAALHWSRDRQVTVLPALVVPVEDTQRPQRVPPARPPVAVLESELGLADVGVLQQPGAVWLPLVSDQLHGLGHARVGSVTGAAEVVQGAQDVVLPARRPRELQPALGRHLTGAQASEQLPRQQVLLAAPTSRGDRDPPPGQLVLEQALEHADRRVERGHGGAVLGLAVPAAIVELVVEQTRDQAVDVRSEVGADRQRPAIDARLHLAVEERLAVVLPSAVR